MNENRIKSAAENITMPEDMKQRIACRIRSAGKEKRIIKRPAVAFTVLAACIMLSATAFAATGVLKGYFRDIVDWRGAVIGTAYEQATDEIIVEAEVSGDELALTAVFVDSQAFPYRSSGQLGIAAYQISDKAGNVLLEGCVEAALVIDGQATISVDLSDIDSGSYRMKIAAFVSEKKADQPLEISGNWELQFEKP